jgi:predicted transcriptional regulator
MNVQNKDMNSNILRTKSQYPSMMELTVGLTAAYVSRNAVPPEDIPVLIGRIHAVFSSIQTGTAPDAIRGLRSGSEVAASIRYDRLVSFIDGKAYKSLKRHLTAHGMTPDEYRSRYGLPRDYPMVSSAYATARSRIAKQIRYGFEVA